MKNKYIITAAFPYTNGYIHIGHLSGVYIPADIYARCLRGLNKDIIFISGSDEHGASIVIKAKKKNIKEKKIINKYHLYIKKNLKKFHISLDNYYRTSSKKHHELCKKIFKKLYLKNFFLEKSNYQYYDKIYKQFLADRFVIGTCPICKYKNCYSDQCEKCGNIINEVKLLKPKSILSNTKPILKKTINLFIPFKKYKNYFKKLLNKFKKNKNIKKNVINQIKSFIKYGLHDRSITRDLKWGIKIPIKKYKNKVLYVWFDALIGYISCTKDLCKKKKKKWTLFWKKKNNKLINFIGKDNIIFHSILFPIIINNYNKKYIIPYNISSNEFLNLEGKKISTSKNWAIWIHNYFKYFPNMEDSLRYSLIMDMPENKDSNFTWKKFQLYNNSELIGILGNFFNRVVVLVNKYYNGIIPKNNKFNKIDIKTINKIFKYPEIISNLILKFKFRLSLFKFMELSRIGNKYLSIKQPWKCNDINNINNTLYISSQIIGIISHLSYIFLPITSKKLLKIINMKKYNILKLKKIKVIIPYNHKINKAKLIFRKITDEEINKQINKLNKI
ncbi:MAG: methionine--tRNA ligase [Candidatus Shikimatogenerans bostrichidophilus]|nr:MAG: methionine--tRNA ligase [Candidatus Shikimatogenerans bostrichidophilus]